MTCKQVFEELLADWRKLETTRTREFSSDFDEDEAETDRKADEWRTRYAAATSEEADEVKKIKVVLDHYQRAYRRALRAIPADLK